MGTEDARKDSDDYYVRTEDEEGEESEGGRGIGGFWLQRCMIEQHKRDSVITVGSNAPSEQGG